MAQSADISADAALIRGPAWNQEPGLGSLTLPGYLREVTSRFADNEALAMPRPGGQTERWTYRDVWDRAHAVARALAGCGAGRDARIGILMTNRPEWVSAFFGAGLAGGTAVGLSTFSTPAELDNLIKASGISILLFERSVAGKDFAAMLCELEPAIATAAPGTLRSVRFPFLRHLAVVDAAGADGAKETRAQFLTRGNAIPPALIDARAAGVTLADPAVLFFSSGSTGKPKGILSAHRGVCIQSWRWKRLYDFDSNVRSWSPNGLFWSGNLAISLGGTFAAGGTLVLQPLFNPAESVALLENERVSFPYCWPHQWAQLEEAAGWDEADLSAFHYFDVAQYLHRPQTSIATQWNDPRAAYGFTEAFTIISALACNLPLAEIAGHSGPALPGNTIRIVDPDTGQTLRKGETGEIAFKGPALMLGYIGVPNDEVLDDRGFFHTGDGGLIDAADRLVFQGRINDIIKTGGANVSPVEVDWTLCACPGVKVCKTTGVPHDTLGEMVVSCVVREDGAMLSEADVIAWVKSRLASYKVPRKVLFVAEADFGMTDTAKIKPAEIRALAARLLAGSAA